MHIPPLITGMHSRLYKMIHGVAYASCSIDTLMLGRMVCLLGIKRRVLVYYGGWAGEARVNHKPLSYPVYI